MVFEKVRNLTDGVASSVKSTVRKIKPKSRGNVYKSVHDLKEGIKISEDQMKYIAETKFYFKKSFILHACIYALVNVMLYIINMVFTPSMIWYLHSVFGWAFVGMIMHVGSYAMFKFGVYPAMKRAVLYNILAYVAVIPYCVAINLITFPVYLWVIYPAFFWGLGIIVLLMIYGIFISGGKKEKEIQKEMAKMRERTG
jgi:cation transport ATPase